MIISMPRNDSDKNSYYPWGFLYVRDILVLKNEWNKIGHC